jgi:predicted TIM-barrel fold metal-dependent hydrolase
MNWTDHVVIVTGAGSGIGEGIAHRFAEAGAEVVIAEINQTRGEAVAHALQAKYGKGHFIQTNVASASDCQTLVNQTVETFGHIDTLVNNAGVNFVKSTLEMDEADWDRVIDVDLKGAFLCSRYVLEKMADNRLVKGIRRIIQFEDDIEFCLQPDFIHGLQALPDYGLSFDICINPMQLANTIKMVAQSPDVPFILDHIGKPDIKNQIFEPWQHEIRTLAGFPNVWCKLSGLVTEADHANWTRDDLKPYIDQVIECFGFERVVFGGDWPVATQASDYPRWVETLAWAVSGASEEEIRKLFHDNAVEFYRL